jgi:hypothetical protein
MVKAVASCSRFCNLKKCLHIIVVGEGFLLWVCSLWLKSNAT